MTKKKGKGGPLETPVSSGALAEPTSALRKRRLSRKAIIEPAADSPPTTSPGVRERSAARSAAELGGLVQVLRERSGHSQQELAELVGLHRSVVALLEQGRAIPEESNLRRIAERVGLGEAHWRPFRSPGSTQRIEFEGLLSELVGVNVSASGLDEHARETLEAKISLLFDGTKTSRQCLDLFRSVLVYYGVAKPSTAFFSRFLGASAFRSNAGLREAVTRYQTEVIRLFATFSEAYSTLVNAPDLPGCLSALDAKSAEFMTSHFMDRRPWNDIEQISDERLPDLGYISAARVEQEERERRVLSDFLQRLAKRVDEVTVAVAIGEVQQRVLARMDSLLKKMKSSFQFSMLGSLFSPNVDADSLRREADRIGPKKAGDIVRMAESQAVAQRNLARYLSADFLDVYVATSMRSDADFVSANRFVELLFAHDDVKPLRLRYFNPTQSWIEDRVAKGLVEALMLRRASATIYMAQNEDTFGKDSEASVSLGQGKPVVVYVPRLLVPEVGIDTEDSFKWTREDLESLLLKDAQSDEDKDFDATVDDDTLLGRLIRVRMERATGGSISAAVRRHWADFDLYGRGATSRFVEAHRGRYREWLDDCLSGGTSLPPAEIRDEFHKLMVAVTVRFEQRARVFREIHPLALQVILSTGVLNGILVVRSVERCAKILVGLLRNQVACELHQDADNYRLVETTTGSTLRVISKHSLIQSAFDAFYKRPDVSTSKP